MVQTKKWHNRSVFSSTNKMASRGRKRPEHANVARDLDGTPSRSQSFAGLGVDGDGLRSRQGSMEPPSSMRTRVDAFRGFGHHVPSPPRPVSARTASFAPLESFPMLSGYPEQSLAPPPRAAGSPRGSKSRPEQKSAPNRVFGRRDRRATRVDFRRSYGGGPPRRGVQGLAKGLGRARDAARVIGWMCKILTHPPKHRSPGV